MKSPTKSADISPMTSPLMEPSLPGTTDPPVLKPVPIQMLKKKIPPIPHFHSSPSFEPSSPTSPPKAPDPPSTHPPTSSMDLPAAPVPGAASPPPPSPGRPLRASTGMLHVPPSVSGAGARLGEEGDAESGHQRSDESMLHRLYRRMITMVDIKTHVHVFVGTWNMHGTIPQNLHGFLPEPPRRPGWRDFSSMFRLDEEHHVLVFGTQECQRSIQESMLFPSKAEWEKKLKAIYKDHYEMVASETMAALHLCIFIRKKLVPFLVVEKRSVATGLAGVVGNKGGVAIALMIERTSFLFVNMHLTAHQHNTLLRNADYQKIETELHFQHFPTTQTLISDGFDYVFFLGDTNYRVDLPLTTMREWSMRSHPSPSDVLNKDQLTKERHARRAFIGFFEPDIHFLPTFKLNMNGQGYDYKRIPAWTDRILIKSSHPMVCLNYKSVTERTGSDHAPVVGLYQIELLEKDEDEDMGGVHWKKKKAKKCGCRCWPFWNVK